jgi:hypothetical protein
MNLTVGQAEKVLSPIASFIKAKQEKAPALRMQTMGTISSGYASRDFVKSIVPELGENEDIPIGEFTQRMGLKKADISAQRKEDTEVRGEVRRASMEAEKLSADQEKAIKNVDALKSFVDDYYNKLDELVPPSDKLSGVLKSAGKVGISKVPIIGSVSEPNIRAFSRFREASRAKIARALGDVGNLSQAEQENAIKLLTGGVSSAREREEAKSLIEDILISAEERALEGVSREKAERARGYLGRKRLFNIGEPKEITLQDGSKARVFP